MACLISNTATFICHGTLGMPHTGSVQGFLPKWLYLLRQFDPSHGVLSDLQVTQQHLHICAKLQYNAVHLLCMLLPHHVISADQAPLLLMLYSTRAFERDITVYIHAYQHAMTLTYSLHTFMIPNIRSIQK